MTEPLPEAIPSRRPRPWVRLLLGALALSIAGIGSAAGFVVWGMGGEAQGAEVTVEIPPGATGSQIADILAEADVIRSPLVFRLIARLRGVDSSLRPGSYEMRAGLGVDGVIDLLRAGIAPAFVRVTIPEGETLVEIADIVSERTHIGRRAFLREARSGRHRIAIMPAGSADLEGLLFPKSYDVTEDMDAGDLIDLMLAQFEIEAEAAGIGRASRFGLTPYEAVIVASMIEREARVQRDRPLISSVIHNRLARPMRLQIDATVQYAILLQTGSYKKPLTQEDYTRVRSAYNTYQIDGLPPGPIASPGLASLRASVRPKDTDFYFYRLSGDGVSHCFATDAAGHAACANA